MGGPVSTTLFPFYSSTFSNPLPGVGLPPGSVAGRISDIRWNGCIYTGCPQNYTTLGSQTVGYRRIQTYLWNYDVFISSNGLKANMILAPIFTPLLALDLKSDTNCAPTYSYWTGLLWIGCSQVRQFFYYSYDGLLWFKSLSGLNTQQVNNTGFRCVTVFKGILYNMAGGRVSYTSDLYSTSTNYVKHNGIDYTVSSSTGYLLNTSTRFVLFYDTTNSGTNKSPIYSNDGLTWISCNLINPTTIMNPGRNILVTNGLIWIRYDSRTIVWYSNDGISWRRFTIPSILPTSAFLLIEWTGTYFIATPEGSCYYSSDGLQWTLGTASSIASFTSRNLYAKYPMTLGQPYTPANPNNWPANYGYGTGPNVPQGPSGPTSIGQALDIIANYLRKYSQFNTNFRTPWPI
jgi:hypothetical protein